jgi:hypothetical protein
MFISPQTKQAVFPSRPKGNFLANRRRMCLSIVAQRGKSTSDPAAAAQKSGVNQDNQVQR